MALQLHEVTKLGRYSNPHTFAVYEALVRFLSIQSQLKASQCNHACENYRIHRMS